VKITKEEYESLEKLFDSRTAEFRRKGNFLLKEYFYLDYLLKGKFDYLLRFPHIEGSGELIDEFFINNNYKGIVVNEFKDAVPFSIASDFSIEEKVKACIDIFRQLSILHSYGMCFNDIHSDNFLIDKDGGHLIDFDEIDYFGGSSHSYKYRLAGSDGNTFFSSVEVDLYKSLICYFDLFYDINFEEKLAVGSIIDISKVSLLFEGTSISQLVDYTTRIMFSDDTEYFPDIKDFIPFILDVERYNYDLKKIKEKLKVLR